MELISSDTNIWFDFNSAGFLSLPFSLSDRYEFIISSDTLKEEVLYPPNLSTQLTELGLRAVKVNPDETLLSVEYLKYRVLSPYDRIALAIAKSRAIILLTGDDGLRKAAEKENVEVHGTLWIADEALHNKKIYSQTYKQLLEALSANPRIRLPKAEIAKRLKAQH